MNSLGKFSPVIIVILGLILLAGYIGPLPARQAVGMSQPSPPLNAAVTLAPGEPAYYLQVHGIRDHIQGEWISISGITNIPGGEQVRLVIYTDELHPETSERAAREFTIDRPSLSEGPWEVRVDARAFPAGKYFLEVSRMSDPAVRTSGQFRILRPERLWMTIASPGSVMTRDGFRINAETNLPAGDTLHVRITERPEKDPQDGYGTWEPEGNTTVNRDSLVKNTWSYQLEALPPAHPGNYSIHACSVNYPETCAWQYFDLIPAIPRPSTSSLAGAIRQ